MFRAKVLFLSLFLSPVLLCSLEPSSSAASEEIADCKRGCGEAPPPPQTEMEGCRKSKCAPAQPKAEPKPMPQKKTNGCKSGGCGEGQPMEESTLENQES